MVLNASDKSLENKINPNVFAIPILIYQQGDVIAVRIGIENALGISYLITLEDHLLLASVVIYLFDLKLVCILLNFDSYLISN